MRAPGGEVRLDMSGRVNGRGAYVCRDGGCIAAATGHGALARALAVSLPAGLAAELVAAADLETAFSGGSLGQE